ncbi:uncharacterized protein VNE69_02268 [Vairimorpha necatrix]|uniref:Rho-GAP domain-containing protein n=1 Tax=Vairimorpha necatrix TaxID=6039 RepID=A0AAX4J9U4_9MICR
MTSDSKIPIEIDIKTENFFKRKNLSVFYNGIMRQNNANDKETPYLKLNKHDQEQVKSFCKTQFESKSPSSYFTCLRSKSEKIEHKKIDKNIFVVLDTIENKIYGILSNNIDGSLDSLKNLFRLDDKGLEISDTDFSNKKLSQLCTLVKKYILTSMDGLFSNLVSKKLLRNFRYNKLKYAILLSYIPFILSEEESRLLTRLLEIFHLIDKNKEYTHMTMSGLLRLFSLVLFDSKCFTSLDMLHDVESVLVDISRLDFQKIPKTMIKKVYKFV